MLLAEDAVSVLRVLPSAVLSKVLGIDERRYGLKIERGSTADVDSLTLAFEKSMSAAEKSGIPTSLGQSPRACEEAISNSDDPNLKWSRALHAGAYACEIGSIDGGDELSGEHYLTMKTEVKDDDEFYAQRPERIRLCCLTFEMRG